MQIVVVVVRALISIHALLAESDSHEKQTYPEQWNFYPRSPCGERLVKEAITFYPPIISIHALLAESDYLGAG